jgi:chemotaxis protein MotA
MRSHVIGLLLGVVIVTVAVLKTGDDSTIYLNLLSVLIVFGGSFSASIITNGLKKTFNIMFLFFKAFSTSKYTKLNITQEMVAIAKKAYFGNIDYSKLSTTEYHPFVIDGLKLIHNKFDSNRLKGILVNMLHQRRDHHEKVVERIETLAKYPPAFGMMGTIIGLVAVLNQISSPDSMSSIGPSMAVALITTLYGIFLANYILQPIADNLHFRSHEDLRIRQIIVEAILMINNGDDPVYIREVLLSYLTPAERSAYQKDGSSIAGIEEVAA